MKKKRKSPMLGRKISEEDRGKNAPKLGRPFDNGPTEKHVVSLSLKPGQMNKLIKRMKCGGKATAIKKLIDENL